MNDEKGIAGFKKADFVAATPERVFGDDVRIDELPDGVRLYLKEQSIDLSTKKALVQVYRLEDDGGLKNKKIWVGKILNRKPNEDEIAERFGGGSFIWILKWKGIDGRETGIISEVIEIDPDYGRAAHEAWKKSQRVTDSTPVTNAPPVPAALGFGGDAVALMQLMDVAAEKNFAMIERIARIFGGNKQETPAEILQGAYKGASEMMMQAVETNLGVVKAMNKQTLKGINNPPPVNESQEDGDTDEVDSPVYPPWIQAFMPYIESSLGKLLQGGPIGAAVKTLVITSDEWQEIFSDKEKWAVAVSAMEKRFGPENTAKALDILLNRKKGKVKA